MPEIGSVKLRTVTPIGGVSESVKFSVEPLPQFCVQTTCFVPLHEVRAKITAIADKTVQCFEFMHVPRMEIGPALAMGGWNSPTTL